MVDSTPRPGRGNLPLVTNRPEPRPYGPLALKKNATGGGGHPVGHPYGRKPGEFLALSPVDQQAVVIQICNHLVSGDRIDTACWCEQVDPDDLKTACQKDPHLMMFIRHRKAKGEKKLRKTLSKGGKGISEAKAALEILERTCQGWERKATVNLPKQLEDVLLALSQRFSEGKQLSGPEAYEIVVAELDRGL